MSETADALQKVLEDLKKRKIPAPVKRAVEATLDKKGDRITVLKLMGLSDVSDYLILCTGYSARQNQAIASEIVDVLSKELRVKALSVEGTLPGEWILLDYVDFIVHVFLPEVRERYALEKMWMDAKRYDFYLD